MEYTTGRWQSWSFSVLHSRHAHWGRHACGGCDGSVHQRRGCWLYCRDVELAKFEAFLSKEGGSNVNAMVRGRQQLAYPIKK